jgi:hypothetical protein
MQAQFSFDFGHRFVDVLNWPVAFLVFSEDNVYTPDPETMQITRHPGGLSITASSFAWAGLQQRASGQFNAQIRYISEGFDCQVTASLHERIKGTAVILKQDRLPAHIPTRDYGEASCPAAGALLRYPASLRLPVFPLRNHDGSFTCVASLDEQVRGKSVAVLPDGREAVIELHHYEDARQWSTYQSTPVWRVVRTADPRPVFQERLDLAQKHWGLKTWEERQDVPGWMRQVGLVLNLHGMHWTGYLFNSYDQQLEIIRYVTDRLPGRHVLAYLAAWDGRYNYNWPHYHANARMGGEEGLRRLVSEAQARGVHVIPQIGAVSANRRFLPPALHDCGIEDAFGNKYVKDVDWDNDRAGDTYRVNANIGHPGFRQFLLDNTQRLKQQYNFDGIFLDINMTFHNDSRFSIVEGHRQFAQKCHELFDDFLIFGENWYDALQPMYPLVHSVTGPVNGYLQRWPELFERYCRTTMHLIHPAPSHDKLGSTGVYERGFEPTFDADENIPAIPAIGFVSDTLREYSQVIDRHIEHARAYLKRQGIV